MRTADHLTNADLIGPGLAENLIDVAAFVGTHFGRLRGIADLDIISVFLAPAKLVEVRHALLENRGTLVCKLRVAIFAGHDFTGLERGVIHAIDPRHDARPVGIQRVVQRAVKDAVVILVGSDHALDGLFDIRPDALEKRAIGRHLVLAIDAENAAGLAVDGEPVAMLAAILDDAVLGERLAEVHKLAVVALDFRKQTAGGLGVLPYVRAGAGAAADALVGIETPAV